MPAFLEPDSARYRQPVEVQRQREAEQSIESLESPPQARFVVLYRPLTVQEMMDEAIALYRRGFWTLLGVSALPYLPILVSFILLLFPIVYFSAVRTEPEASGIPEILNLLWAFIFLLPWPIIQGLQNGLVSLGGSGYFLGHRPTLKQVLQAIKPRIGHLILNQVIAGMLLWMVLGIISFVYLVAIVAWSVSVMNFFTTMPTVGIVSLILGWVVISLLFLGLYAVGVVWFMLNPQIVVLENRNFAAAMARNFELVRRQFWRTVGCCLAFWGLQTILTLAFLILLALLVGLVIALLSIYYDLQSLMIRWFTALNYMSNLYSFWSYIVVMPPLYLCNLLLYYDLRFRTEGLDLSLIIQNEERQG